MNHFILLCSLFLLTFIAQGAIRSRVHDYETTRQKSSGGAGVASILVNEATLLNPAPLAFFSNSSFYYQQGKTQYFGEELPPDYSQEFKSRGIIIADTKSNLKGALGYQDQQEGPNQRQRLSISLSSSMNKDSALGILYRRTTDQHGSSPEDKYQQFAIGSTHVINESFSLGAVIVDPLKNKPEDVRAVIGAQYILKDILTLIFDIGGNYSADLAQSIILRGAFQLNFFNNFYLRAGLFEDNALKNKGSGFGLAWIGPKLVLETSFKTTRDFNDHDQNLLDRSLTMKETSLSLSYFF